MKLQSLILLPCLVAILLPFTTMAQAIEEEEKAVMAVIRDLFDAMEEADTARIRSLFLPEAFMKTALIDEKGSKIIEGSLKQFLERLGTPHSSPYIEKIANDQVMIDLPMAAAWMDFHFYVGDTFSHCGVNNFVLLKTEGTWKIAGVTDTRRKEPCDRHGFEP